MVSDLLIRVSNYLNTTKNDEENPHYISFSVGFLRHSSAFDNFDID